MNPVARTYGMRIFLPPDLPYEDRKIGGDRVQFVAPSLFMSIGSAFPVPSSSRGSGGEDLEQDIVVFSLISCD
ncbi:hypothetical protein [Methanofollis sp. W23]|uniref:hypothetical protein n=1 Tax=Methanofollis sp. W23 TaxID=2817849 RepID=UPI001AE31AB7|nr:hypothetical protein [Methanofollis sp. W23]